LPVLGFEDTGGPNVVASGFDFVLTGFVGPFFVPYPSVLIEAEKLAADAVWDVTKHTTTNFRFFPDRFAICGRTLIFSTFGTDNTE
jgi:hypothetical protein